MNGNEEHIQTSMILADYEPMVLVFTEHKIVCLKLHDHWNQQLSTYLHTEFT
jgi:hypothetical protein